ncbi:hypothetical protein POM88_004821 [Heracleum sosnowskyi]|uniref:Mitochondrial adenine nucleotide transporter BTL3 n=1 Tax=Heracleum sosnowskyi TaxID=360622 RepID=A0AAD8JKA6_9APIA|nr:hypothetical protein POM88_004821 [Heracleum sosnowskyi]
MSTEAPLSTRTLFVSELPITVFFKPRSKTRVTVLLWTLERCRGGVRSADCRLPSADCLLTLVYCQLRRLQQCQTYNPRMRMRLRWEILMKGYDAIAGSLLDNPPVVVADNKRIIRFKTRRGRGAMNTTKHLWAGAVPAMLSRFLLSISIFHFYFLISLAAFYPISAILEISGKKKETTNIERFISGAAAGVTATVLCLPLETIRTKLVAPGGEALGGVIGAFCHVVQTEGFFSLYKGLLPSILSMAPSAAVFYGVYDMLKSAYLHSPEGRTRIRNMKQQGQELNIWEQLELGPVRTLLHGAISVERGGVPALFAGLVPSLLQKLFDVLLLLLKMERKSPDSTSQTSKAASVGLIYDAIDD